MSIMRRYATAALGTVMLLSAAGWAAAKKWDAASFHVLLYIGLQVTLIQQNTRSR